MPFAGRDARKPATLLVAAITTMLAAPERAEAQTTFCGGGPYGTRAESVWQAIKNYGAATNPQRNCQWCHTSTWGTDNAHYVHSAFEMDILEDWIKTSYFLPGFSKAYAAYRRIVLKVMPPGKWSTAEPELTALQDKLADWQYNMYFCGTNADCIWGTDLDNDDSDFSGGTHRCGW